MLYPIAAWSARPLLSLLTLWGILVVSPDITRCDTTLFWDDFSDGSADNWMVVDFGEFAVVDEKLCFATVCEP